MSTFTRVYAACRTCGDVHAISIPCPRKKRAPDFPSPREGRSEVPIYAPGTQRRPRASVIQPRRTAIDRLPNWPWVAPTSYQAPTQFASPGFIPTPHQKQKAPPPFPAPITRRRSWATTPATPHPRTGKGLSFRDGFVPLVRAIASTAKDALTSPHTPRMPKPETLNYGRGLRPSLREHTPNTNYSSWRSPPRQPQPQPPQRPRRGTEYRGNLRPSRQGAGSGY
ncbi:hypothetical protein BV22DRAFT_1046991 [Leucogyrophana mollusca]|uniref:Uncharacterized protein n=1 Tax=Leucogyrophana mollusca TaxID=85980 RepID=A0ACB8BIF3_9AGAM|nr:hypothetical protein BV22DRAFT_1046991 [Leucogyrophana mollusca]